VNKGEKQGLGYVPRPPRRVCCILFVRLPSNPPNERGALMFTSLTSKVVTAVCAVIGAIAFLSIFFLAVTGGSPYLQFGLALLFFAMFIVGSYWWIVFGPGRSL
jgi:hypothetical protein